MGETQNTFKQRISQHLDDIYNFIPFRRKFDKEVAVHFNLKSHNYLNDFKCAIYNDKLNDSLKSINEFLILAECFFLSFFGFIDYLLKIIFNKNKKIVDKLINIRAIIQYF